MYSRYIWDMNQLFYFAYEEDNIDSESDLIASGANICFSSFNLILPS